jgi:hypothetical protein
MKISSVLTILLIPFVKFALKKGIKFQAISSVLKAAMVEQAKNELASISTDVSISKISAATGIHRLEIQKILDAKGSDSEVSDVLTRLIGAWCTNKKFLDKSGKPKPLSIEGKSEFLKLVDSISKDLSHYTVLFELERINAIEVKNGFATLLVKQFVPDKDSIDGYKLVSRDIDTLIQAGQKNIESSDCAEKSLHFNTTFDNIALGSLSKINEKLIDIGRNVHDNVRGVLSKHDLDINESLKKESGGGKVTFITVAVVDSPQDNKIINAKKRGRKKKNVSK